VNRLRRPLAFAIFTFAFGLAVLRFAFMFARPAPVSPIDELEATLNSLWPLAFAAVGILITTSRPQTRIGWLLLAIGVDGSLLNATSEAIAFADAAGVAWSPGHLARATNDLTWATVFPLMFLLLQLFPGGRPLSRRWGSIAVLTAIWPLLLILDLSLSPIGMTGGVPVPNPSGIQGPIGDLLVSLTDILFVIWAGLGVVSLVAVLLRTRRARQAERQQLKWLGYGLVPASIALVIAVLGVSDWAEPIVSVLILWAPVAIGIAVLRYRLYDIDLLISRTLVYAATSAAIAATFFIGIVALQTLLRPLTAGSELAVAASTLVSFALFQPIRRRVQDVVDRRFDRSRYDAARTLDAFADRLRDEVDLDALRLDLLGAVEWTMAPAHAGLWLRERPR